LSAWKACDIRGKFPEEVSPQLLHRIGAHIGSGLAAQSRVTIAGDFRLSTPQLKAALAEALVLGGACVLDAGQVPTPVAYFAHHRWQTDAVLIVTASHNPPDHNGLKFMIGGMPPSEEDLRLLRASLPGPAGVREGGSLQQRDPLPDYKRWIRERWGGLASAGPLHVVLDAGSGAWSEIAPEIFEQLGFRVSRLFCRIDGRFPHRPPDCARPANLGELSQTVRQAKADLGVAWDGDGDRVAFAADDGSLVTADQVSALLAKYLLRGDVQGERIVYDLKLSDVLRRTIQELGSTAIVERSGHTFLKRRMIEQDCLLGCEASGHYFFRELRGGDDGVFAALLMTDVVGRQGRLSALVAALPPMFVSPELRIPEARFGFDELVGRLRETLGPARETLLDGVRLETPDGFVLIRRSVTEPAITFRLEGLDGVRYRRLLGRCSRVLPELSREPDGRSHESGTG
jgi:phosphomannomutase / phosphoglucomutase